jgi:hypothetical protein
MDGKGSEDVLTAFACTKLLQKPGCIFRSYYNLHNISTGKNDYTYLRKNEVCSLVKDKKSNEEIPYQQDHKSKISRIKPSFQTTGFQTNVIFDSWTSVVILEMFGLAVIDCSTWSKSLRQQGPRRRKDETSRPDRSISPNFIPDCHRMQFWAKSASGRTHPHWFCLR